MSNHTLHSVYNKLLLIPEGQVRRLPLLQDGSKDMDLIEHIKEVQRQRLLWPMDVSFNEDYTKVKVIGFELTGQQQLPI